MSFFGIDSPRAMLDKAEWNYAQFKSEPTIYRAADFFISAHHIYDYVKNAVKLDPDGKVVPSWLTEFTNQQDMRDCRDLCDVTKHSKLTKKNRITPDTFVLTGEIGGAEMGTLEVCAEDKWVMTTANNREVEVVWLADRAIQKWRELFAQRGL